MNKTELIAFAAKEAGISKKDAALAIEAAFTGITNSLILNNIYFKYFEVLGLMWRLSSDFH